MGLKAEWRTRGDSDAILIVDDADKVQQALAADAELLNKLLTDPGDLDGWHGAEAIDGEKRDPAAWGALIISRANTGEIINMDPERFWTGIYYWFRSRGIDYNSDGLPDPRFANFLAMVPMVRLPEIDFEAMEEEAVDIEDVPGAWFSAEEEKKSNGIDHPRPR